MYHKSILVGFTAGRTAMPTRYRGICHPEQVIKPLYLIVLIVDNLTMFGCVGTVQTRCANFRQFRCCKSYARSISPEEPLHICSCPRSSSDSVPFSGAQTRLDLDGSGNYLIVDISLGRFVEILTHISQILKSHPDRRAMVQERVVRAHLR